MTAYALMYGATPADRFSAVRCADRAAARDHVKRHTPHVPPEGNAGGCGYVIESPEDVTWGGALLVAVYGALTGSAPSKFETRAAGIDRLMRALETHAHSPTVLAPEHTDAEQQPAQENPQTMEVTDMPKSNTVPKRRGRPPNAAASKVSLSHKINPGSGRAKFVKAVDGINTTEQIKKRLGLTDAQLKSAFARLKTFKGIAVKIEEGDRPVLVFPAGKTLNDYLSE